MTTVQTKVLMPEKKKKVTLAQVILVTIIMLFVLICVLPIINVASVSLSSKSAILRGDVAFLPVEPTINAYKAIVRDVYDEIWASNLVLQPLELPEALKRKKCCKSTTKRKKAYGATIDERPEITSSRLEVGHWESDTVVGKRKGKEAVILTLLEKKTQHYLAIRIPGKTSEALNAAMQKLREDFGESFFSQIFKTITVDNGPEFADFAQTEQFGTKVYFAHPYTSWERAQNERQNGMLRRYVPKGVSIENFSDEEILWAADALNGLPRSNLGYCTPEELFEAFLDTVYAA